MIWGWIHYANTTDENCYDPDHPDTEHAINPRTLLFGILVAQAIMMGLACLCIPFLICQASKLESVDGAMPGV